MVTIEECQPSFWQYVSNLLEIIFKTLEEVQIKELNDAINVIVSNFNEEIQPFAIQITNTLL